MHQIRTMAAVMGAAILLSACGGDDNVGDVAKVLGISSPEIRIENTANNGDVYDLLVNGAAVKEQTNVTYPVITHFVSFGKGAASIGYARSGSTAALASGSFADAADGHEYTVVAFGGASSPGIGLIDDPFAKDLASNDARVRIFNASANAQNLDLYLVVAGTAISAVSPMMAGVSFGNAVPASGQNSLSLAGGTYVAVATVANTKTTVFQSAPFNVSNNANLLITTVPVPGQPSQLQPGQIHLLVAQDSNTTSQSAQELINTLTGQ